MTLTNYLVDCPPNQADDKFQYLNEVHQSDGLDWNDRLISDPDKEIIFVLDEPKISLVFIQRRDKAYP